ncbi:cellulose biosynthesis protein BcsR [Erwinia sp. E_sp_B04_7]|uniref:cellulose biosynthesis protein BcsR n=1 Tax=unclassified Erwinia TaxID=2622719 RepID=UPI0030CD64A5
MNETRTSVLSNNSETQDDIRALADAFSLQNWRYIDIARQEKLEKIIARWPLLAELVSATPAGER